MLSEDPTVRLMLMKTVTEATLEIWNPNAGQAREVYPHGQRPWHMRCSLGNTSVWVGGIAHVDPLLPVSLTMNFVVTIWSGLRQNKRTLSRSLNYRAWGKTGPQPLEWDGGMYLLGMSQVHGFSLWPEGTLWRQWEAFQFSMKINNNTAKEVKWNIQIFFASIQNFQ